MEQALNRPLARTNGPEIGRADRADRRRIVEVMQAAFDDDPVARFLQPRASKRAAGIASFTKTALRLPPGRREVYLAGEGTAAAIWSPPDEWPLSVRESLPFLLRSLRTPLRFPVSMRFFAAADRLHPDEPHWYLDLVGTHPEHQGKGMGAALLRPVLDRCDKEGLPVWTYSSNPENLAFYHRLGFEVLDEVVLIKNAPTVFPIRREPRA